MTVDGVVKKAYCSACHDNFFLEEDAGSAAEQEAKLAEAFNRHLRFRHSQTDVKPK
jgi:hypothetical protein